MKYISLIAGTAAITAASFAMADSHEEVNPAVTARQSHMQLYAYNLGILGGMAQGKIDYDAEAAQTAADSMVALTSMNTASYWPEGTAEGTKAQPAIWENLDDFMSKGEDLAFEVEGMADVAGTDLASLQGAMGNLGGTCSACHREYRARD
ncbi:cytochrome c [Octadecabacter sp. 1_MG-2023]|uniref:c-type cytochrome n=1 Tax=unclassified Octadecabacter TaxID=196158 RepID=UPI001C0941D5|nr:MULTISPECIES: cytochrome c [unclassified Octadecabacter]MBU2993321.1 cytochrome c [Octadecabacter sp. B2R22]MDO6733223.1 cytochrome c [Octadecabacter sp. 1_MG-2023]